MRYNTLTPARQGFAGDPRLEVGRFQMNAQPDTHNNKTPGSRPGAKDAAKDVLQTLPTPELEKQLVSSPDGLSQAEAQQRLAHYGPNEIAEKQTSALRKFLGYF